MKNTPDHEQLGPTTATSTVRWDRLKRAFHAALEAAPEERPILVRDACQGDEALEHEVLELLETDRAAEQFLDPDNCPGPAASAAGQQIGPYRILQELGRGGMGAAYLAERVDGEYKKRVAVKVLRFGLADPAQLERFRRERQILASLTHANIAGSWMVALPVTARPISSWTMSRVSRSTPIARQSGCRCTHGSNCFSAFAPLCTMRIRT